MQADTPYERNYQGFKKLADDYQSVVNRLRTAGFPVEFKTGGVATSQTIGSVADRIIEDYRREGHLAKLHVSGVGDRTRDILTLLLDGKSVDKVTEEIMRMKFQEGINSQAAEEEDLFKWKSDLKREYEE